MWTEKEAIYSLGSAYVQIVDQELAKIFSNIRGNFNLTKSIRKWHFKKIVSHLYRRGLFDERVSKLMKIYSRREAELFSASLGCYHRILHTTSEKIVNVLRQRCSSLSEAKIIADTIFRNRYDNMVETIRGYSDKIVQSISVLETKLRSIIKRANRKSATKTSKFPKQNGNETNRNSEGEILQKSNIPSSAKILSAAEINKSNCSKIVLNFQSFLVSSKFDWKYFRKK